MHAVLLDVVDAHGLKRARADVQRDVSELDARLAAGLQDRRVEMQAGGRRGNRAGLAREHGLVALAILEFGRAGDVRRQRHLAQCDRRCRARRC